MCSANIGAAGTATAARSGSRLPKYTRKRKRKISHKSLLLGEQLSELGLDSAAAFR